MNGRIGLVEIDPMSAQELTPERPVVVEVDVDEVYDLRRAVLRRGTPSDNVVFVADDDADTRHFAIRNDAGDVIATSTWSMSECPHDPGVRALQLRGMAVRDDARRRGLGAALIDAGVRFGGELGVELVWANARDTALAFYSARGFDVVGDGFLTADTQIPHHVIVRRL